MKVMVGNLDRSSTSCLYIIYLNTVYCINSIKLFEHLSRCLVDYYSR